MVATTHNLGRVWVDWDGQLAHSLLIDLTVLKFFVDTGPEFLPLTLYLKPHPERRGEAVRVVAEGFRR